MIHDSATSSEYDFKYLLLRFLQRKEEDTTESAVAL